MSLAESHSPQPIHTADVPTVRASLLAICNAMGSAQGLDSVLHTILSQTLEEMAAQEGSILLLDEQRDRLEMLASIGLPAVVTEKGYIPRKGSIAEWVIENNEPLILNDQPTNVRRGYKAMGDRREILSAMCVPLRAGGRVIGTINLNRTTVAPGFFDGRDLDLMQVLTAQAAIFIENSRLHEANVQSERLAAVGQTVAGISHCIKNMLTGVKGGMSLIEMASKAQNWELLGKGEDILKRNLSRMSTLVLDMLDYSKEREPRKGKVMITDLAQEVLDGVRSEATLRNITLENRVGDRTDSIEADGQSLFRCLLNLAHNAVDVTPEDGTIWFDASRTEDPQALKRMRDKQATAAVVLRLGDSGPGIDADNIPVLFEPFFSTKGSRGTGLGLAVTRKIIEEHGGFIEMESPPNTPAVFAIYLPA